MDRGFNEYVGLEKGQLKDKNVRSLQRDDSEDKIKVDNYSSDTSSLESEITESHASEVKDKVINLQPQ